MAEHWAATSASFDHLADAARPRQQGDQNPILTNFVPTRMPLLQRASMPESFIIRLLFLRNDLRRFQLATKPMRNLAP